MAERLCCSLCGEVEGKPGQRCRICGETLALVEYDPAAERQETEDFLAALYGSADRALAELDQLQAEARASGRDLSEVLLWNAVADMELDAMLDRGDQGGE